MLSNPVSTALSGSLFGSALLLTGVYSPTAITSQLLLNDFHMLKVFLTASASSAILMFIAKRTNISPCNPRKPSNLNRFHQYDGNITGGVLLGIGMALTGSCPGTVIVQVATGVPSGIYILGGAILGGTLWALFGHYAKRTIPATTEANTKGSRCNKDFTIQEYANIEESQAFHIYEIVCIVILASASYFMPGTLKFEHLNPVFGGLLIGAAQAASLVLTGSAIGVSIAYERIGQYICRITGLLSNTDFSWPSASPIFFILGMLGGSWGLAGSVGLKVLEEPVHISPAKAVIGGVALIVGARTAGGCTSGHGISGMATMSIASFITVAAMFAGGIGASMLL